ncbi:MAG TPA: HAD-IB family hydrolase [Mycobacteriales bacterium]
MPDGTSIEQRLSGAHVLLTGVTGFVGEALLHRLLSELPATRVSVLVRRRGSTSGTDRVRTLLNKSIFEAVRSDAGGLDALLDRRVQVLEGDLAQVPALPTDLDAVVHCASDVSFDPPIDGALATNVVGTRALLQRVAEVGDHVHYVHMSTAYVAGRRRGVIPEGPLDHTVDVDEETDWGLAQEPVLQQRSREPELLARLQAEADRAHGAAGPMTTAVDVETRRKAWVRDELVRLGTQRARSLGWTDCYTFTKALGERVAEARASRGPTTILRPSIIESALETPHPGWIEGFKMAEPIILAFGRGELPEFPAAPDGVIDVIPVDHVVAATVAALAHPPEAGQAAYLHISSGVANPLRYGVFHDEVRRYFDAHPFVLADRGAPRLPPLDFPGARRVERLLANGERAQRLADRIVSHAPRGDRVREAARSLDRQGRRLQQLRRLFDLYVEYAQADLRFDDAHTRALYASLGGDDRRRFAFDPLDIDWRHYIAEVHCPAITAPIRRLDAARRGRTAAPGLLPATAVDGARAAAFFDFDGTLLSSNVIETYLWSRLRGASAGTRAAEVGRVLVRLPGLVRTERHHRDAFLRAAYRRYAGARLADLEALAEGPLADHLLGRLAPDAVRRIREHRAAGQPTVLVTGAIRPLTRPLAPLFDHIEAVDLAVDERGVCTGHLAGTPLVGEARATWVQAWSAQHDVDLQASFAYADSYNDLALLGAVGHPVAVRPDVALSRYARRKRWPVVDWPSPATSPRLLDPVRGR